jgi:CHAD domain-containing protein
MSRILKYVNKRFREVHSCLKKYRHAAQPEDLHKIRTELKKIKTLFRLLAFRSKQFNAPKAYKPLKDIFSKAGHIRALEVLHHLFCEYELEEFEKNNISGKKKREKEVSRFQKSTHRYIKQVKQSRKQLKKHLAEIDMYDLEKYMKEIEDQLCGRLFQQLRQDELHPLRKQIKELAYLSEIINGETIPQQTAAFDKLQELIGQWHDKDILKTALEKSKTPLLVVNRIKAQCAADLKLINTMAEEMYLNRCIKD